MDSSSSILLLVLFAALAAVCTALIIAVPGLGILLTILAIPPLVRTTLVLYRRQQQGIPTSWTKRAALFLGSAVVTLQAVFIVIPAALFTFCYTCITLIGVQSWLPDDELNFFIPIATISGVFALVAAVLILLPFFKKIRTRWHRDTTASDTTGHDDG